MVKVGMRKMEDRLSFLKSVPLLRGLEPLLLSRIADHLQIVKRNQEKFQPAWRPFQGTLIIVSERL